MPNIVAGKVAIVTGAGRGIGRGIALLLAQEGARVVVCDIGASLDGAGTDTGPAQTVVKEIEKAGGQAIASTLSISEPGNADKIVAAVSKAKELSEKNDVALLRFALEMPRSKFARLMGRTERAVVDWESGKAIPQGLSQQRLRELDEAAAEADIRTIMVRQERIGLHMCDAIAKVMFAD